MNVKSALTGEATTIDFEVVAVCPGGGSGSVTVRVTVRVPALEYVLLTGDPDPDELSPNVQPYVNGGVPFPDTVAVNVTDSPVTGFAGENEKSIVRAVGLGRLSPAVANGDHIAPPAERRSDCSTIAAMIAAAKIPDERARVPSSGIAQLSHP